MPATLDSPTLILALRKLDQADGKALLKLAIKELIALRVLAVETVEERRRMRGPRRRLVLVDGPAPMPPGHLLAGVAEMVASAPTEVADGRVARDLGEVARHLAAHPKVRRRVVEVALAELAAAGLVTTGERRVLGVVRRTVHVRTAAGEAELGDDASRRRSGARGVDGGGGTSFHGSEVENHHHSDGAFDSGFDSAFDSSFDSSFDSGFSSGDGGGGGGDGGGGGGDGGGGGS